MKHNYYVEYDNILLRPLQHDDIEKLRIWRNDFQATRFLRHIGYITPEMQEFWFQKYLNNKLEITFAIVEKVELNRFIGSVSIYDIRRADAEFGKIQIGDSQAHGKGIGRKVTVMALAFAFDVLKIKKITACVHQENIAAYKNYMRIGFKITGTKKFEGGGIENLIEIDRNTLFSVNDYAKDIRFVIYE